MPHTSATQPRPRTAPVGPDSSAGRVVTIVVGVLVLIIASATLDLFALDEHDLESSTAFTAIVDLAAHSAAVNKALGEPVRTALGVTGVVHDETASGYAILSIPMSGSKDIGTLYAVANRMQGSWDIEREVLQIGDGSKPSERINLTPPTQREKIDYPAPGLVYLLPLDNDSVSDIKDLPAYFKARLGLDVTILPIQQLPPDAVDPNSKQLIGEAALDSIERAHQNILDNMDAVIIGITSQDLNIQAYRWGFATNFRRGRFGIVSTARLHSMPPFAGANPEVFPVRVRKLITKNLAILHYQFGLVPDPTSALATSAFTFEDVDEMGENFEGESGSVLATDDAPPCVTIMQDPAGKQSWELACSANPPLDSRYETFAAYPGIPLFVQARSDFSFGAQYPFAFVRKYRPQDDASRAFGVGASDSFDIVPLGDSQTFSQIDLFLPDSSRIDYRRISPGTGVSNAVLRAGDEPGSPFSNSILSWNGNGWNIDTTDGWTYQFPSSGPEKTELQGALIGMHSASGRSFTIERSANSDLSEIRGSDGLLLHFVCDAAHRITSAHDSAGRTVEYEYDADGMLAHVHDAENGDEYYQYDPAHQLIAVLDAQHHALLTNKYGYAGELRSQTLADGRTLIFQPEYNEFHKLVYLKLTLPDGYSIVWMLTRNGFTESWPQPPISAAAPPRP
jgi:YD repeat-containing protein